MEVLPPPIGLSVLALSQALSENRSEDEEENDAVESESNDNCVSGIIDACEKTPESEKSLFGWRFAEKLRFFVGGVGMHALSARGGIIVNVRFSRGVFNNNDDDKVEDEGGINFFSAEKV